MPTLLLILKRGIRKKKTHDPTMIFHIMAVENAFIPLMLQTTPKKLHYAPDITRTLVGDGAESSHIDRI